MALTNAQKQALAGLIIRGAADALALYGSNPNNSPESDVLADATSGDLYEQTSRWLSRLPGPFWDARLPQQD